MYRHIAILAILAGCIAEPASEPVPADDDDSAVVEPEVLDCIVLSPEPGQVDGPAAIGVLNECAEPVECDVIGGGVHWPGIVEPGGSWVSPYDLCGYYTGWCSGQSLAVGWAWEIDCGT